MDANNYPPEAARTYFLKEADEVFVHLCDQLAEIRFAPENETPWRPDYREAGESLETLCSAFGLTRPPRPGPSLQTPWGPVLEMALRVSQLVQGAREAALDLLDWNDALGDIHRLHDALHDAEDAHKEN